MIDKIAVSLEAAVAGISDGSNILVGGFGTAGMDLAIGAKQTWVMMEHVTRDGQHKLVPRCTYPLTGKACVSRIYTDLAVIDVTAEGFAAVEIVPGLAFEQLAAVMGGPLCDGRKKVAAL